MFLADMSWNRNRAAASLPRNLGGVIFAVAVMWPRASWTVQPGHSEGVDHCWSVSPSRSAARAARSRWMYGHGLGFAIMAPFIDAASLHDEISHRPGEPDSAQLTRSQVD